MAYRMLPDGSVAEISEEELARPAEAPALPSIVQWGTVIRRMTPDEAVVFDAAVNAAQARFKWLVTKTDYIATDDQDYPTLEAAFVDAYGPERAAELLASG
jgi:hypothetical protein